MLMHGEQNPNDRQEQQQHRTTTDEHGTKPLRAFGLLELRDVYRMSDHVLRILKERHGVVVLLVDAYEQRRQRTTETRIPVRWNTTRSEQSAHLRTLD